MFIREWSLIASNETVGEDLSALRIVFKTTQSDIQTPNSAAIRVYNLNDDTAAKIEKQYTNVVLQCGYRDGPPLAVVFQGTIKQVRKGRESAIDSYVDILAADGDFAYNEATVCQTIAAGSTVAQRAQVPMDAMASKGVSEGYTEGLSVGGILPRGKVFYGMARDYQTDICHSVDTTWSIQNGQVQILTRQGYLPGEAVVLNSQTGLIGTPEQTEGGIVARCLINPGIKIGGRVRINNADINQTVNKDPSDLRAYNNPWGGPQLLASVAADGIYRVLVVEHEGDTRGTPWYSNIVCLRIDSSAPAGQQVLA